MKSIVLIGLCIISNTLLYSQNSNKKSFPLAITHLKDTTSGIQFNHTNTWEELLQKAKKENKLVYVDVYTTWCGPCKWMKDNVFNVKEVGEIYNQSFLSFKAQIDTSKNDDGNIKSHYQDYKNIADKYNIKGYPTHLFINGDGEIVHKKLGMLDSKEFIELSKDALNPDKQFGTLKKQFDAGNRDPKLLFNLIKASVQAYENEMKNKAMGAYMPTQKDFFTKENVELLLEVTSSEKDKGFDLIKNNPEKIDRVLDEGSARKKLRWIGIYRIAYPIIYNNKDQKIPDFNTVEQEITTHIGKAYSKEIAEYSKVIYYLSHRKYKELEGAINSYTNKFSIKELSANDFNNFAWSVFENVPDDTAMLQKALQWGLQSVEKESRSHNNDTVANLYFKLGDKDKAIEYAQKALDLVKAENGNIADYEKTLQKFKESK